MVAVLGDPAPPTPTPTNNGCDGCGSPCPGEENMMVSFRGERCSSEDERGRPVIGMPVLLVVCDGYFPNKFFSPNTSSLDSSIRRRNCGSLLALTSSCRSSAFTLSPLPSLSASSFLQHTSIIIKIICEKTYGLNEGDDCTVPCGFVGCIVWPQVTK